MVKMKKGTFNIVFSLSLLLVFMTLIPISQSQTYYQTYFWITETGTPLSAVEVTGDLDSDHVQLSEIVVCGRGNISLIDGFDGTTLGNYSVSPTITYNALATGNLDADAFNEIVAGSQNANLLTAIKYTPASDNLSLMWEVNYNVTQVQIADITGNSVNEVVVGDALGNLTVLFNNSTVLWSYNLTQPVENFQCVDLTQDNIIDGIIVLTDSLVTLLNITGVQRWQVGVASKPLNVIIGDIMETSGFEIIVKGEQITNTFAQNGTVLWNSTSYTSNSSAIILHDYLGGSYPEILIGINNGSFFLNGTDGSVLKSYLTHSSVSALGISNFFGETANYLMMGDYASNLTLWKLDGTYLYNVTLTGAVLDILLIDMNADGILDIVTASSNGTIYVIGLPWLIDFNWVFVGIGIACGIIIVSILIIYYQKKTPQTVDLTKTN